MKKKANRFWKRIMVSGRTQAQRLFIALQFFGDNGLANHAAAGAYGFLLSAVPTLLLVSFFLLAAFRSSPQAVSGLAASIPFLDIAFNEEWLTTDLLALSRPGISGFISVVSIFWAGRVFAVSLQRGLAIIFPGSKKRNPLTHNMVTIVIEILVLLFALVMILCSQTALRFYGAFGFLPAASPFVTALSTLRLRIFPLIVLGLIPYCACRIVPANAPGRLSALWGSLCCVIPYELTSQVLKLIINQTRYNFLYGALGNLIILLVNVYFFFVFFFFGAQLAFVLDTFDALLFAKFRQARSTTGKNAPNGIVKMVNKLFFPVEGKLEKYLREYREGVTIFSKGDTGEEIFYLLAGEVEVSVSAADNSNGPVSDLRPGAFFGEMSHLLSEGRNATIRAKTGVSVLALPPGVFDEVLKYDAGMDRAIIEHLSRRLKHTNEQISALTIPHDFSE
jgi:membrane protein